LLALNISWIMWNSFIIYKSIIIMII